MTRTPALLPPLLALPLALTACTGGAAGGGPSLLPRAIEQRTFDEPAAAPAAAVAADPALDGGIAAAMAAVGAAEQEFFAADRRAAPALAAGGRARVGSDAWLDAQTALAALDEQRALLLAALSDLEQFAIARATAGEPPYPALESARVGADAVLDRVGAAVAARKAQLADQ